MQEFPNRNTSQVGFRLSFDCQGVSQWPLTDRVSKGKKRFFVATILLDLK